MQVVLVAQPIAPEGIAILTSQGFEVRRLAVCDRDALKAGVSDADALLVRNANVDREIIEAGPRLRVIARHGAGLDTIDLGGGFAEGHPGHVHARGEQCLRCRAHPRDDHCAGEEHDARR